MGHIYKISNMIDDRIYIGSTINIKGRWTEHKRKLSMNKHENIHLQRFVNKYGINSIYFDIIEEVDNNVLLSKEQHYIDVTKNKFNIAICSSAPMFGKNHSIESLKKISLSSSGINNPMYGKKRPSWLIDKLIMISKNRIQTKDEKIKRLINLSNRLELIIQKDNIIHYCFSVHHASKIIKVSHQAVSKALKNNTKSNGWMIKKSNIIFYNKDVLLQNINLFEDDFTPKLELIEMLKALKNIK